MLTLVAWIALGLVCLAMVKLVAVGQTASDALTHSRAVAKGADENFVHTAERDSALAARIEVLQTRIETLQSELTEFRPVHIEIQPWWGPILADRGLCSEDDWSKELGAAGLRFFEKWPGLIRLTWLSPSLVFHPDAGRQFSPSPACRFVAFEVDRDGFSWLNTITMYLRAEGDDYQLGIITPESRENDPHRSLPIPFGHGDENPLATIPAFVIQPWIATDPGKLTKLQWTEEKDDFPRRNESRVSHRYFNIFTGSRYD